MAFHAEGGLHERLGDALAEARKCARDVKRTSESLNADSAAGAIPVSRIVGFMDFLQVSHDRLTALKALDGMGQYAKDQYDDQLYDVVAEANTMLTQIAGTISWIDTNMPKDSVTDRWIHEAEIVNGRRVNRTINSAGTAPLRTELDALEATID